MAVERRIQVEDADMLHKLFGTLDHNVKVIMDTFPVRIASRDNEVIVIGENHDYVNMVETLVISLMDTIQTGNLIDEQKLDYYINSVQEGDISRVAELNDDIIVVTSRGKFVKSKTLGQKQYYQSILNNDVTFGVGPAGTGKTYLAVAMAVRAFKNNEVSRIVITRPAVEAGESLGFLPGDLQDKVDPYLRPLYDALYDILGAETYLKYKERGLIEVAPLAYMRGRTLDNSFIILDEAQNTTKEQMKMFLTRFGFGSKVVVNGDATQVDLPGGKKSGLKDAVEILSDVEGIAVVELTHRDVVRHRLVKKIIECYEKRDKKAAHQETKAPHQKENKPHRK
ncbi:MAG: PhoH family protein [Clostridia bacterium]|nr:PhoH family protein [Clostridia bacterium]